MGLEPEGRYATEVKRDVANPALKSRAKITATLRVDCLVGRVGCDS
jgi:hypothetical protein